MTESMAICEYFEEKYTHLPRLLPTDPDKRFLVRRLCEHQNAGTQPLANLGVLNQIEAMFGAEHRNSWGQHWDNKRLGMFEQLIAQTRGQFCVGDEITLADLFLIPAVYRAGRFEIDYKKWPIIAEIHDRVQEMDFAKKAHCDAQIDAVL